MLPISKHLVRILAIMLLALVAFPEHAYSGILSKSFLKEYSQKMCLQAQRKHTSLALEARRKEKELDALKQRQQRGEDVDLGELYNLSCDCVRLNTEAVQAHADIDFWTSVLESYKGAGKQNLLLPTTIVRWTAVLFQKCRLRPALCVMAVAVVFSVWEAGGCRCRST